MRDRVPNERLREAILDSGLSLSEIARNAELMKPNTNGVRVALGLKPSISTSRGRKYRSIYKNIDYDMAVRLCRAAGLDPVDVGLQLESWITTVFTRGGKRAAKRHELRVPLDAATGHFERLSDRALNDLLQDLQTEKLRRFSA